jgi:hypothetical protein
MARTAAIRSQRAKTLVSSLAFRQGSAAKQ